MVFRTNLLGRRRRIAVPGNYVGTGMTALETLQAMFRAADYSRIEIH